MSLLQNLLLLPLLSVLDSDVRGAQRAGNQESGHSKVSLGSLLVLTA